MTHHLAGFGSNSLNDIVVFCTDATKQLIRGFHNIEYDKNLEKIRVCRFNETISLHNGTLKVTFIPVYHCIGSAMILLEAPDHKILYTGDARFDSPILKLVSMNHRLLEYIANSAWLDTIYLDTTFSYRSKNIQIMDRYIGIEMLIQSIQTYPIGTKFNLINTTCGFEDVWMRLAWKFGVSSLAFDESLRKRFELLRKVRDKFELMTNPVDNFLNFLGLHQSEAKGKPTDQSSPYSFYVGKGFEGCDVRVSAAINITSREFNQRYIGKGKGEFKKLVIDDQNTYSGTFAYHINDRVSIDLTQRYLPFPERGILLPTELKFVFSRHSSCQECLKFLAAFKGNVREVYPTVYNTEAWIRGFSMQRYFGNFCMRNSFRFDREMNEKYGSSAISFTEPVKLANYWPTESNPYRRHLDLLGQSGGIKGEKVERGTSLYRIRKLRKYRKLHHSDNREKVFEQSENHQKVFKSHKVPEMNITNSESSSNDNDRHMEEAVIAKQLQLTSRKEIMDSISISIDYSVIESSTTTETDSEPQKAELNRWNDYVVEPTKEFGNCEEPISVKDIYCQKYNRRRADVRHRILKIL
ncbi:hypothetical protein FOA43_000430 [Brettanomyces nanus]|uniref:Uncharacterized protein n=1 Tax=Eeniella nana TaxID=13502 RepID=A0A875RYJ3_EENNA|nr:uncharacterized protein FOA43_000430 [Brettanomyces nanus]QPG73125.1 hypothetical protein FOA43_000430 [Brettanomyces nanus]